MRILFISHAFYPSFGGIESSALTFLREFTDRGHEVRVITNTPLGDMSELTGASILRRPSYSEQWRAGRWADVAYQHNPSLSLGLPMIACGNGVVSVRTWIARSDGSRTLVDHLKQAWLLPWRVIANSRATAASLYTRSKVISNPFDDSVFPLTHHSQGQREGIAVVARLVSDKGVDTAIKAIAELKTLGQAQTLTIIGEGPERDALERLARESDVVDLVSFAGRLPPQEVGALLRKHRYLWVPSRWEEPFGIVALEGMASGCFVVATARGGLIDAVGDGGLLVPHADPTGFAEAVLRLETDKALCSALAERAMEHARQHTAAAVADRYLQVLFPDRASTRRGSPGEQS